MMLDGYADQVDVDVILFLDEIALIETVDLKRPNVSL